MKTNISSKIYKVLGARSLMEGFELNSFSISRKNDPEAEIIYFGSEEPGSFLMKLLAKKEVLFFISSGIGLILINISNLRRTQDMRLIIP